MISSPALAPTPSHSPGAARLEFSACMGGNLARAMSTHAGLFIQSSSVWVSSLARLEAAGAATDRRITPFRRVAPAFNGLWQYRLVA